MPVIDILSAALSRPAGRVVEGPVRAIVTEVLQDRGYASPAEVLALKDELGELRQVLDRLSTEVESLRVEAATLRAQADALRDSPPAASAPAAPAPGPSTATRAPATPARLGMSLEEYERWRQGGLPGRIGPDGLVELDGQAFRVDPSLEGRPFTLSKHKTPRLLVDGQPVEKEPVG